MDAETVAHGSPHADHAHAHAGSSIVQIRLGLEAMTIAIVVSMLVVIGACALIMGLNLSKQAQMDAAFKDLKTQEWLVERRMMDREAYDILNGLKVPGDDIHGPTGNLQRMTPRR
jgi:signal transduction histidine kinase